MNTRNPTPYAEINALLEELLESVRATLGNHFVGMYLDGSLATGDFDRDSDIDFVVVTDEQVTSDLFSTLQALHDRLATTNSEWAIQLEGSYISQHALRRYDSARALHPNIERGKGQRLKMAQHGEAWITHRHVLREHGITLAGPPPRTLIDPVSPDDLRQAMQKILRGWAARILVNPAQISGRGYQSYTVLSLCRILYTLQYGTVISKPAAARWAQDALGEWWSPLIERAWAGRHNPQADASPEDAKGTLELIRHALECAEQFERNNEEI